MRYKTLSVGHSILLVPDLVWLVAELLQTAGVLVTRLLLFVQKLHISLVLAQSHDAYPQQSGILVNQGAAYASSVTCLSGHSGLRHSSSVTCDT